jgi:hypothetical protein
MYITWGRGTPKTGTDDDGEKMVSVVGCQKDIVVGDILLRVALMTPLATSSCSPGLDIKALSRALRGLPPDAGARCKE